MKIVDKRVLLQDRGALRIKANRLARTCTKKIRASGYLSILKVLDEHHINEPVSRDGEEAGKIARVCCSDWWQRQLTKQSERKCEHSAIQSGLVSRNVSAYISKALFSHIEAKQKASIESMEKLEVVNVKTGETVDMTTISKGSISNPEVRLAELMVRCRGFESFAKKQGHIAAFYTITAPSKYHAMAWNEVSKKSYKNRNYSGVTPRETQDYLTTLWARTRAMLKRADLNYYGLRVCEPHHDGTPHWHLLLFMKPEHEKSITQIMKKYALAEEGDEPGAEEHRFKVKLIDEAKGSAARYIFKYISKNINGSCMTKDHESGLDASDAADRVKAWASLWCIRQFQMLGGASVGVWRELRRIKQCPDGLLLSEAMQAADAGDWEQYLMLQGGADVDRKKQPIKCYTVKRLNPETGEPHTNKYGEPVDKVEGVQAADGSSVQTRFDDWIIQRKPPELKSVEQSKFDKLVNVENPIAFCFNNLVSRSIVNNCTQQALKSDLVRRCSVTRVTTSVWSRSSLRHSLFDIPSR